MIGNIYMKAFWYNVCSKLFTSWSTEVETGHGTENYIYMWLYWKQIFPRTNLPISIKLSTNHPCEKGILNCSKKGPVPLQRGNNHKKCKNRVGSFKNILNIHWYRIAHIYMKDFWYNVDSSLFKSWSSGVGRGHNRKNHIWMCL
jgi:hypothetical protein